MERTEDVKTNLERFYGKGLVNMMDPVTG